MPRPGSLARSLPLSSARAARWPAGVTLAIFLAACGSGATGSSPGDSPANSGGSAGPPGGSTTGGAAGNLAVATGGVGAGGGPSSGGGTGGTNASAGGNTGGVRGGDPEGASAGAAGDSAGRNGSGGGAGSIGTGETGGSGIGASGSAARGGDSAGGTAGGNGGSTSNGGGLGGNTARPARVLLYSFSTLDIPSVPAQLALFKQQLEGWQYQVDQSKDPAVFSDATLAKYAAVGMINTCFSPFGANKAGAAESQALQKFLKDGGGLFGTHCADVTFQSANPPALYNQLIGGRASSQNFDGSSDCRKVGDHPTVVRLPDTFRYTGNLDATDFIRADTTVLVNCTWNNGSQKDVAVSWVRNEGLGRVFYTNFGKVDGDLRNATIGDNHVLAGLSWVLGR